MQEATLAPVHCCQEGTRKKQEIIPSAIWVEGDSINGAKMSTNRAKFLSKDLQHNICVTWNANAKERERRGGGGDCWAMETSPAGARRVLLFSSTYNTMLLLTSSLILTRSLASQQV